MRACAVRFSPLKIRSCNMHKQQQIVWTALTSFAGGCLAGLLLASRQGQDVRRRLAIQAQESLHRIEAQLAALEEDVEAAGYRLAERVRTATHGAFDPFSVAMPEGWSLRREEIAQDLRHLPRR